VHNDDETLEDYLERFLYILQMLKLKFDFSTIRTLFLCGLIDDARNNLNLLGQGDISHKTFDHICDFCMKYSRNLLGPYNTSDYPITIVVVSLINIFVPLLSPYCYYCEP